jgi:hypothetical protein
VLFKKEGGVMSQSFCCNLAKGPEEKKRYKVNIISNIYLFSLAILQKLDVAA